MPRKVVAPTDQTTSASTSSTTPVNDTAQADPVTGSKVGVSLSVTAFYESAADPPSGAYARTYYTVNGSDFVIIRSILLPANTGTYTNVENLGTIDTTNLAVRAEAKGDGVNPSTCSISAWSVSVVAPGAMIEG